MGFRNQQEELEKVFSSKHISNGLRNFIFPHFVKVLQYQCGSEAGGPPDCLQYYTGTSGTVANFGFDTSQTDVAATSKYIILNLFCSHFGTVSPLFMFSIIQPLFLQKTKPLYPNPKFLGTLII